METSKRSLKVSFDVHSANHVSVNMKSSRGVYLFDHNMCGLISQMLISPEAKSICTSLDFLVQARANIANWLVFHVFLSCLYRFNSIENRSSLRQYQVDTQSLMLRAPRFVSVIDLFQCK